MNTFADSPPVNAAPFKLESEPSPRRRSRLRRAHCVEVVDAVLALAKHWDEDQRSSSPKSRETFQSWLRLLKQNADSLNAAAVIGFKGSGYDNVEFVQMTALCEAALAPADGARSDGNPLREGLSNPLINPVKRALTFEAVVGVAQEFGLFEELLEVDKDGELDRKCRTGFARMLKRYDCRVFKGTIRMSATGAGHGRKYVFERIKGG